MLSLCSKVRIRPTAFAVLATALASVIAACTTGAPKSGYSLALSEPGWNNQFTSNCPLPSRDAIVSVTDEDQATPFLRFTLRDKDKGGCSTDRKRRHSAPYWERAELKQVATLKPDTAFEVRFKLRLVEGFSGDRETFFQLHAYAKHCTSAGPPFMLKMDADHTGQSSLILAAQNDRSRHRVHRSNRHLATVLGRWSDVAITFDTSASPTVTVHWDGERLFDAIPFWIKPCGEPHIKFGIYRPGNRTGNVTSIADFDEFVLSTVTTK